MSARRVTVERSPRAVERVHGTFDQGTFDHGSSGHGSFDLGEDPVAAQVRAAVSAQLRVALTTVAVVLGVLTGLPLLVGLLSPSGVWLVLTLAVQPVWVVLAVVQLRRAERLER